jgi:LysR family transcriptional regulator (chromosome initiation inhibitor)
VHFLPSPSAIVEACLSGIGWALNPEPLVEAHIACGRLDDVKPGKWLDVPLYWQEWALDSPILTALSACLRQHARRILRRN